MVSNGWGDLVTGCLPNRHILLPIAFHCSAFGLALWSHQPEHDGGTGTLPTACQIVRRHQSNVKFAMFWFPSSHQRTQCLSLPPCPVNLVNSYSWWLPTQPAANSWQAAGGELFGLCPWGEWLACCLEGRIARHELCCAALDIPFWLSVWHIFWNSFWHAFLALFPFYLSRMCSGILSGCLLAFYLAYLLRFFLACVSGTLSGIISGTFSNILSSISSNILSGISLN